jgi:hypothetical protein
MGVPRSSLLGVTVQVHILLTMTNKAKEKGEAYHQIIFQHRRGYVHAILIFTQPQTLLQLHETEH